MFKETIKPCQIFVEFHNNVSMMALNAEHLNFVTDSRCDIFALVPEEKYQKLFDDLPNIHFSSLNIGIVTDVDQSVYDVQDIEKKFEYTNIDIEGKCMYD